MPRVYSCNKWKCGKCKKVILQAVEKCPKCGELKSAGESLLRLPGDWLCECGASNFRKHSKCFKCGAAKSG